MTRVAVNSVKAMNYLRGSFRALLVLIKPDLFRPRAMAGQDEGGGLHQTNWPPVLPISDLRVRPASFVRLAKLENFFPKFVVLRELLVVSNGQGINFFRSDLVGRLDLRMGRYAAADGHGFLSFFSEHPAVP